MACLGGPFFLPKFTSSGGRIAFALIYAALSVAVIGVYVRDYLRSRRNLGVTASLDAE